ncbi:MAG: hypothetical protein ABH862_01960 [Candidatus Omnitrophota bacterium]
MDMRDLLKIEKISGKDRVMIIMLVLAIVIFVLVLLGNVNNRKNRVTLVKEKAVSGLVEKADPLPSKEKVKKAKIERKMLSSEMEKLTKDVGREDPFMPAPKRDYKQDKYGFALRLEGITIDSEGRPMAIINDEIVSVGNKVADGEVIRIDKDRVFIKMGEKERELILWSDQSPSNIEEGE